MVKDTSEQWYRLGAVRPSSGESSSQYGVRISTVVEEGQVDYVPVAAPSRKACSQSRGPSSPGKGKKKVAHSPVQVRRQFEVSSPPVSSRKRAVTDDSNFTAALMTGSPRGKTRVGEIEKLLQFFKEECHNCLFVTDVLLSALFLFFLV